MPHRTGSFGTHPLLGQLLLAGGKITPAELQQALAYGEATGERLGAALVAMEMVTQEDIEATLATQHRYDPPPSDA